jgi:hypothetical protein
MVKLSYLEAIQSIIEPAGFAESQFNPLQGGI